MAGFRFYKLVLSGPNPIHLSEVGLAIGGSRVDGPASFACDSEPVSGVLSDLRDEDTGTGCLMPPTVSFTWDFGVGESAVVGSPVLGSMTEPWVGLVAEMLVSSDGVSWASDQVCFGVDFPGAHSYTTSAAVSEPRDLTPVAFRFDSRIGMYKPAAAFWWNDPRGVDQAINTSGWPQLHQGAGSYAPDIDATLGGAYFDGDSVALRNLDAATFGRLVPGAWCMALVRPQASTGYRTIFNSARQTSGQRRLNLLAGSTANPNVFGCRASRTTTTTEVTGSVARLDTWSLVLAEARYNDGTLALYVNGDIDGINSSAFGGAGLTEDIAWTSLTVGAANTAEFYTGNIHLLLGNDGLLTSIQRDKLFGWAAHAFGMASLLPVDHPYRDNPPEAILSSGFVVAAPHPNSKVDSLGAQPDWLVAPPDGPHRARPNYILDPLGTNNGRVSGTVKTKADPVNLPVHRRVRLHREIDGMQIDETWSDPATGEYEFLYVDREFRYTVVSYDHTHNKRAVIADNLTPEAM